MIKEIQMEYRPDIDGLRAIAILFVIIYHAFPKLFPAGYIGVDIFFVISGYLITRIIFNNLAHGTFSFKIFYYRRIRRLFPVLLLVLITVLIVGWNVYFNNEFRVLGLDVFSGTSFISNITFLKTISYFETNAKLKPLINLWSLGVEEQFYLFWPVILVILWKYTKLLKKYYLFFIILISIIISYVFNLIALYYEKEHIAFYSPITRFWELSFGSLLSYITMYKNNIYNNKYFFIKNIYIVRNIVSVFGFSLLIISCYYISINPKISSYLLILPILSVFFIILAGPTTILSRKILSNRLMVFIGLISAHPEMKV